MRGGGRRPLRGGPHPAPGGAVELRDPRDAGSATAPGSATSRSASTRARTSAWSWRRGRGWRRGRPGSPSTEEADRQALGTLAARLRDADASQRHRLLEAARPAAVGLMRRTADRETATRSGPWPLTVERELAGFSAWYEMFPRSEGARAAAGRHLPERGRPPPGHRRDGLRHRLSPPHPPHRAELPQGPQQQHRPATGGRRLPLGRRGGGGRPHRDPPRSRHPRRLRPLRRRGRAAGARGRPRLRAPVQPRPPLGDRAPGVVQPPRRRQHPLRGEPPQALPGHLPARLRQRGSRRPLARAARRAALLDRARRPGVPGRQSAHQTVRLLGVADRRRPSRAPRRRVPGRGLHPPGGDAAAGQARLQPVLHVLHLAQHQDRAERVPHRALPDRAGRLVPAQLLGQHPRHPARVPAAGRPGGLPGARHPGGADRPLLGDVQRLRALRATSPSRRAARSTPTPRSTSSARATGNVPTAWHRTSRASTRSGTGIGRRSR